MEIVSAAHSKLLAPIGPLNNSPAKSLQPTVARGRKLSARGFATIAAAIALLAVVLSGCNGVVHTTTTPTGNGSSDPTAPVITTQPVSQTIAVGKSATFVVVATGSASLSYQWQKNGANISGATSASYTTTPATTGDNAAKFSVVVANSAGSVTSNAATLTVTPAQQGNGAPQITTQPGSQSVTAGQTATFIVIATGSPTLAYQWQKNHANIAGANSASYTTPATATSDSGESFDVMVSNSLGTVTSVSVSLTVNAAGGTPPVNSTSADVTTYHYDNLRTGENTHETILTHAKVNSSTFGLLGTIPVDGHVDAQPLYLSNVAVPGQGTRNVLYVVTEHDSVYAFDADSVSGSSATTLWHSSMLAAGETSSDDRNCGQVSPEIGITSTPVIDRTRNAIYVVAVSKTSGGNYIHRFHALDLTTGKELFGGPTTITATFPGSGANSSNGNVVFDPKQYNERARSSSNRQHDLHDVGSHCDAGPYTSWVMAYSADTLHQSGVIDLVPNGNKAASGWQARPRVRMRRATSTSLSAMATLVRRSTPTDSRSTSNCGNCFAKFPPPRQPALNDYFTPSNTVMESAARYRFRFRRPLLLPDITDPTAQTRHLAVGCW